MSRAPIPPLFDCLPHRPPALLVAEVLRVDETGGRVALTAAATAEPLALTEAAAQCTAALSGAQARMGLRTRSETESAPDGPGMLVGISSLTVGEGGIQGVVALEARCEHRLGSMARWYVWAGDETAPSFSVVLQVHRGAPA